MAQLPAYKAGKKVSGGNGLAPYKLSSNENPNGPLPSILAAIADAAHEIHRYPDSFSTQLVTALAERFNVDPAKIGVGTGSVGVCQQLVQSTTDAGDEVMFAWRSFEAYPIIATIAGAKSVQVPLRDDGGHDLGAMLAAITDRTRLIFICTPNNPTGTIVQHVELEEFLKQVPTDILVVLDEAYVEFNRDSTAVDGLTFLNQFPNVGVLRTFSKAYGLAALRVGFFIGPSNIAQAVRMTAVPFGVSTIAEAAAVASLSAEDELLKRVDDLVQRREWFESELTRIGANFLPSQANFVWLALGEETQRFTELCEAQAVSVRPFFGEGVRISIGEREPLERVLKLLENFAV